MAGGPFARGGSCHCAPCLRVFSGDLADGIEDVEEAEAVIPHRAHRAVTEEKEALGQFYLMGTGVQSQK